MKWSWPIYCNLVICTSFPKFINVKNHCKIWLYLSCNRVPLIIGTNSHSCYYFSHLLLLITICCYLLPLFIVIYCYILLLFISVAYALYFVNLVPVKIRTWNITWSNYWLFHIYKSSCIIKSCYQAVVVCSLPV